MEQEAAHESKLLVPKIKSASIIALIRLIKSL